VSQAPHTNAGTAAGAARGEARGGAANTPVHTMHPPGAPEATDTPADTRRYLLEQVDDAAVVQLYADGFPHLPRG
jgi:hypothetical protein